MIRMAWFDVFKFRVFFDIGSLLTEKQSHFFCYFGENILRNTNSDDCLFNITNVVSNIKFNSND